MIFFDGFDITNEVMALTVRDSFRRSVAPQLRVERCERNTSLSTFVLATSLAIGSADWYLIGSRSVTEASENLAVAAIEISDTERFAVKAVLDAAGVARTAAGPGAR